MGAYATSFQNVTKHFLSVSHRQGPIGELQDMATVDDYVALVYGFVALVYGFLCDVEYLYQLWLLGKQQGYQQVPLERKKN